MNIDQLNQREQAYWKKYCSNTGLDPYSTPVEASIAGNPSIANELLHLYLSGKKTAGSSLLKYYEVTTTPLPQIGNYWIILDSNNVPSCIVKTIKIDINVFEDMPQYIAIAEGEGDLSLAYWKKAHTEFFSPFVANWNINQLTKEKIVTEFYQVVYSSIEPIPHHQ